VIEDAPYDRERTSMAAFPACALCQAEYADPRDRRFHAQAIACHACGPQLYLLDAAGPRTSGSGEPLEALAQVIARGGIGALKGIGGFHLICDAACDGAARALRARKVRDAKPFAAWSRTSRARSGSASSMLRRAARSSPRRDRS
jgi:hydrogenase maturation protein HypF